MKIKKGIALLLAAIFCTGLLASCRDSTDELINAPSSLLSKENKVAKKKESEKEIRVKIRIGEKEFAGILFNNASTNALKKQLPLTIEMGELNGNEKFYNLPESLPTNEEAVQRVSSGALMLFGADCLVLFYKGFETSYSYTRLGYIEDASGLAEELGSGSVRVTLDTVH